MKPKSFIGLFLVSLIWFGIPSASFAAAPIFLTVSPVDIIQGDPIMASVQGLQGTTTVASISFAGRPLRLFMYKGSPTALYGFDIHKKAGVYAISARLSDGSVIEKKILVGERKKESISFDIPAKLGGNATSSQVALVSSLSTENASLLGLKTGAKAFWSLGFAYPVAPAFVTDPYGYVRATGQTTITHKGADFRAGEGTPVKAINRGVVRLVQETRDYGKTIVVDHGLGLMSFYMHLSRIYVNEGELVSRGGVIGLSGQTGYAESPHLHLSVRIDDISIDPVKFLDLFR